VSERYCGNENCRRPLHTAVCVKCEPVQFEARADTLAEIAADVHEYLKWGNIVYARERLRKALGAYREG